jgi:mucin-2
MKTIEPVNIWDNGTSKEATILNAYAVNVTLNKSATFWYGLFSETESGEQGPQLAVGNVSMSGDDYAAWQEDTAAWDFIADKLNLTITGDYVAPAIEEPAAEEITTEEPIAEEETVTEEPATEESNTNETTTEETTEEETIEEPTAEDEIIPE